MTAIPGIFPRTAAAEDLVEVLLPALLLFADPDTLRVSSADLRAAVRTEAVQYALSALSESELALLPRAFHAEVNSSPTSVFGSTYCYTISEDDGTTYTGHGWDAEDAEDAHGGPSEKPPDRLAATEEPPDWRAEAWRTRALLLAALYFTLTAAAEFEFKGDILNKLEAHLVVALAVWDYYAKRNKRKGH